MTSKVLVKLPTVPFSQGKKSAPEIVTLTTRNEGGGSGVVGVNQSVRSQQGINGDRTAQLEQNMKFLQDQHQATLIALHQEVELLRQRNRDLQFQLVFTKDSSNSPSPSSPEDNSNGFVKSKGSPVCVNVTPLQIELLERDLEELKTSFNDAKKDNLHLQEVIEKQKLKLDEADNEKKEFQMSHVGIQVGKSLESIQSDLTARLEDAEAMVKRLRSENADQQKEIAAIKASSARNGKRSGHGRGRGNENGHHSRGSPGESRQSSINSHKLPPLESESYWRNASRGRPSYNHHSGQHNRRTPLEKDVNEPNMSHIGGPAALNRGRLGHDHPSSQLHRRLSSEPVEPHRSLTHFVYTDSQNREKTCYLPFFESEEQGYPKGVTYFQRDLRNRSLNRRRMNRQPPGKLLQNYIPTEKPFLDQLREMEERNFFGNAHAFKKQ